MATLKNYCSYFLSVAISLFAYFNANAITPQIGGHEYVDLGLSVKWATCNIGAASPTDNGDYFAWGETETKEDFSLQTLKYCVDLGKLKYSYEKYNTDAEKGTVDNVKTLEKDDDAANVLWGGTWRMPTSIEVDELIKNCSVTWVSENGIEGCKFTSKKNGKSIFLPAAGRKVDKQVSGLSTNSAYWSSSLGAWGPVTVNALTIYKKTPSATSSITVNVRKEGLQRSIGCQIRPVSK